MIDWKESKLKNICVVKGGKRLPSGHSLIKEITNHPYIKARDIKKGKIATDSFEYLDDSTFTKISRYIVNVNDICITVVANIGDVGIVTDYLDGANLTENAVKLSKLDKTISPYFVNYLLSSKYYKEYMNLLASGAAQAKLGIYKIENIKIKFPPFEEQQQIAQILTAYDDLIETNNHRIATLEQLAQQIYKEWFVRLRFPNWENTPLHHGIPEGWTQILFGDIAKEVKRHIKLKDLKPDSIYVGLEHLPVKSIALQNWDIAENINSDKLLFRQGEILFCKIRPYLHKVALASVNGSCSSGQRRTRPGRTRRPPAGWAWRRPRPAPARPGGTRRTRGSGIR